MDKERGFPKRKSTRLKCFDYSTAGAYFVTSYNCRYALAAAFDPLGYEIASSTNYYKNLVVDLNLDYKIVHLDDNREKLFAAKKKYGDKLQIKDNGYIGTLVLTSESEDFTAEDIIREFDIPTREDYYSFTRIHRKNTKLIK